jgi:hypothetical protein
MLSSSSFSFACAVTPNASPALTNAAMIRLFAFMVYSELVALLFRFVQKTAGQM